MANIFSRGRNRPRTGLTAQTFGRVDPAAVYMRTRLWTALAALAINSVFAALVGHPELWLMPLATVPIIFDALRRRNRPNQPVMAPLVMDMTAVGVIVTVAGLSPVTVAWGLLLIAAASVFTPERRLLRWLYPYILGWMAAGSTVSWLYDSWSRWGPVTGTAFTILQVLLTMIALAALITEIMRELQNFERERNSLIGGFVHDMKNALTGTVGMAELLTTHFDVLDRDEVHEYATMVLQEGREAMAMTEDLLAIERAEAGHLQLSLEPVKLSNIANQLLTAMGNDAETELEKSRHEPVCTADPVKVRQIIRNLVSNADRYGGERLRITVGTDDDTVYLRVADSGPPIPEVERARIFDAYQRARHQSQHSQSVGLGLSISRHLARLMGGDLTYRHSDGWSTFELTLPRVDSSAGSTLEESGEVITTQAEWIWLGEDGILRSRIRPRAEIGLEDARAAVDGYCKAAGSTKRPLLVYTENTGYLDRQARDHYTGETAAGCISAVAFVVDISPTARILAGYIARLSDPPFPVQLFDYEEDALEWLDRYRSAPAAQVLAPR